MAKKNKLYHSNATMDNGEKLGENVGMNYNSEGADFKGNIISNRNFSNIELRYKLSSLLGDRNKVVKYLTVSQNNSNSLEEIFK